MLQRALARTCGGALRSACPTVVKAPIRLPAGSDRPDGPRGARLSSGGSRATWGVWASASENDMTAMVQQKNEERKVVVYSRSWCPYCGEVKALFNKLEVEFTEVALDQIVEGEDIMDALFGMTKSRTVPQVFVGGKYLGGADDTMGLFKRGELKGIFEGAGVASAL